MLTFFLRVLALIVLVVAGAFILQLAVVLTIGFVGIGLWQAGFLGKCIVVLVGGIFIIFGGVNSASRD